MSLLLVCRGVNYFSRKVEKLSIGMDHFTTKIGSKDVGFPPKKTSNLFDVLNLSRSVGMFLSGGGEEECCQGKEMATI